MAGRILQAKIAAVTVGIKETHGAPWWRRFDGRPPWIAADTEPAIGRAVIAAILGKYLGTPGHQTSQDESLVVGLAAAVDEKAGVQISGRSLGQFSRQRRPLFGDELRRNTAASLRLPLDCRDHAPVAVAEIAMKELGQKIEIRPALAVEEIDALRPVELQDRIFAFLDRPGQQEMFPPRSRWRHKSLIRTYMRVASRFAPA